MAQNECNAKKAGVSRHYRRQWESYSVDEVLERVSNLSPILDAIITHLEMKQGLRILDLGCGPAVLPIRITDTLGEPVKLCGIDISFQALHLGKKVIEDMKPGQYINLVRGDCEALPFGSEYFDAVISNATINLLPDKTKGFWELARVTKAGGSVVIGDCTARENKKCGQGDNGQLWSACVAGAPMIGEFEELSQKAGLEIQKILELTREVSGLVRDGVWDWPEFIQHDMDYHVFVMSKKRDE